MKIAVYTIAKNEESNVEPFMRSASEADLVVIADTGSTDNTIAEFQKHGVNPIPIQVEPWNYAVARNVALSFVPEDVDYCVSIDLDETLSEGWRMELERVLTQEQPDLLSVTWVVPNGEHNLTCHKPRIHKRHGMKWFGKIHENLKLENGTETTKVKHLENIYKYHKPDHWNDYSALVDEAIENEPNNPEHRISRVSDHLHKKEYEQAMEQIRAYLSITHDTDDPMILQQRSIQMVLVAHCHLNLGHPVNHIMRWLLRAVGECPWRRENWVYLAECFLADKNYPSAYAAATNALSITDKRLSMVVEEQCWGDHPKQIQNEAWQGMFGAKEENNGTGRTATESNRV